MMKSKPKITSPKGALAIGPSFNSGIKCDRFIERCAQQPKFEIIGIVASQGIGFGMEQEIIGFSTDSPPPPSLPDRHRGGRTELDDEFENF